MLTNLLKLLRLRRDDRADGILVMGLMFIPIMVMCAGFAMDLTKSVYIKSSFQSYAQEAASNAIRDVNNKGGINESAISSFMHNYQNQTRGKSGATDANQYGTGEVSGMVRQGRCDTVKVPGHAEPRGAPYTIVKLKPTRAMDDAASATYESWGGWPPALVSGTYRDTDRVMEVTVYDAVPNIMLSMIGIPCQTFATTVSAVTFGNQEDIKDNIGGEEPPFSWMPYPAENYDLCSVAGTEIRWPSNSFKEGDLFGFRDGGWHLLDVDTWTGVDLMAEVSKYSRFVIYATTPTGQSINFACENPQHDPRPIQTIPHYPWQPALAPADMYFKCGIGGTWVSWGEHDFEWNSLWGRDGDGNLILIGYNYGWTWSDVGAENIKKYAAFAMIGAQKDGKVYNYGCVNEAFSPPSHNPEAQSIWPWQEEKPANLYRRCVANTEGQVSWNTSGITGTGAVWGRNNTGSWVNLSSGNSPLSISHGTLRNYRFISVMATTTDGKTVNFGCNYDKWDPATTPTAADCPALIKRSTASVLKNVNATRKAARHTYTWIPKVNSPYMMRITVRTTQNSLVQTAVEEASASSGTITFDQRLAHSSTKPATSAGPWSTTVHIAIPGTTYSQTCPVATP